MIAGLSGAAWRRIVPFAASRVVPVIAYAVTNGALAVWVVLTGRWQFW